MKFAQHIKFGTAQIHAELDIDILLQYWIMSFHCQNTKMTVRRKTKHFKPYIYENFFFTYFDFPNLIPEFCTQITGHPLNRT